ncbi:Extensin (fragment) (plasmid) [Streptantibioticus cattleyicolor NRRL 8057 = DSM 46488]
MASPKAPDAHPHSAHPPTHPPLTPAQTNRTQPMTPLTHDPRTHDPTHQPAPPTLLPSNQATPARTPS